MFLLTVLENQQQGSAEDADDTIFWPTAPSHLDSTLSLYLQHNM